MNVLLFIYLYFYDLKIDFMQWSESCGGGMKGTVRYFGLFSFEGELNFIFWRLI
jgi:hypothetical protein